MARPLGDYESEYQREDERVKRDQEQRGIVCGKMGAQQILEHGVRFDSKVQ